MTKTVVIIYFIVIGIISVIVTCLDKFKAKHRQWRVPEATLLMLSALGGAVPMLLTMLIIRHKTKHPKFMIGIPVIILVHILIIAILFKMNILPL